MNRLIGQQDPRSDVGKFSRGANLYPGGTAPHTTNGPQSFAAQGANNGSAPPVGDKLRAAALRRLVERYGVNL